MKFYSLLINFGIILQVYFSPFTADKWQDMLHVSTSIVAV